MVPNLFRGARKRVGTWLTFGSQRMKIVSTIVVIVASVMVALVTGCRSRAMDLKPYADYSAIYFARAMQQSWTYSDFTNYIASARELEVITPQGHCRIRKPSVFCDIGENDAGRAFADAKHFFTFEPTASAGPPYKAYKYVYFSLPRDIYTKSLPQNFLNQVTWGQSGSGSTTFVPREPQRYSAVVMCDRSGNMIRVGIERPYPLWHLQDLVKTEFPDVGENR